MMLMSHRAYRRTVTGRNAAWYMLTMVIAFAITVVGTRLYLDITGYPQLGNSTFHFAHALWGGLLQVLAAVLMLMYLNEWVFSLAAALAGVGIGLFIDEIGKFITQSNDYFFPLAAPIIYVAFILFVFAYLYIRRHRIDDTRATLYGVLEDLEMFLDDNLDAKTHTSLVHRLETASAQNQRPDLAEFAKILLQFLKSEQVNIKSPKVTIWSQFLDRLSKIEERWLPKAVAQRLLIAAFTGLAAISLFKMVVLLSIIVDQKALAYPVIAGFLENNPLIKGVYSLNWYIVLLTIEGAIGILYTAAVICFLGKRERAAVQIGSTALILSLTISNTLAFYFNQFSVVLDSLLLAVVLLLLARYRARFGQISLRPPSAFQPLETHVERG
jgi:hypothetical protein